MNRSLRSLPVGKHAPLAVLLLCLGLSAVSGAGAVEASTDVLPEQATSVAPGTDHVDLEYGEEINEVCAGCHGEYGQGSGDGEYPRLAGLDARYITRQLRFFKDRSRLNIPMLPYATERELPEADIAAIAAYLSQIDLPTRLPPIDEANFDAYARLQASKRVVNISRYPGDVMAGKQLYRRECASCHADDGMGKPDKQAPRLVGQYSNYLLRQVEKIRSGERLHDDPDDAEVFREYSDDDIDNILAWLSVQDD